MKVVILHKSQVSSFPPILALIETLNSLGIEIHLICGQDNEEFIHNLRLKCKEVHLVNINPKKGKIGKIITWLRIRISFWKIIYANSYQNELFWIPTADTTLALGKKLLKLNYVLNLYELFDTFPRYRNGLEIYAKKAKVVVCPERTRAHIFQSWWDLKELPTVLPNKSYVIDRKKNREIPIEISNEINRIRVSGKKIAIYQGILTSDRGLEALCSAFDSNERFSLILMGKETPTSKKLIEKYKNIVYLSFVLPPFHLNITSHADIGVLSYDNSTLNNIFCAPNKIWEYSGLGIPMLGNNIPGLIDIIDANYLGKCADFNNKNDIKKSLTAIEENYNEMSQNSYNFFNTVNLKELVEYIINKAIRNDN